MKRFLALAVTLALGTLPSVAHARNPAFVQVTEKEWSLTLSRQRVRSGQVVLEAVNFGMDAHNLALRRAVSGARVVRLPLIGHGEHVDRTLKLAAGRYTLWCTLPGHRGRGMVATLVVAK